MEGKEQFDEYLGGSQSLPGEVHIMKLVSSRASEIAAMTYSIENPQRTKLVFQKLPMYMRRRVMSHNAKRLPRRLREAHLNQMAKSGLPPKNKRPSRRYRRRPRNLLMEYNRRQRKKMWLETHIWHAKRFRMTEKWGYRIASQANDKCFKANYRALARHCLIQDISYYGCVQLVGPEEILKETLKRHCNPKELSFAAKIYTTGNREGTVLFFRDNAYPWHAIGYVHFLWRPGQIDPRSLWIWVHPSMIDDVLAEISSSFQFKPDLVSTESSSRPNTGITCYSDERNCKMTVFKNVFNRFRLYGPSATTVLTNSLRLPNSPAKSLPKAHGEQGMDNEEGMVIEDSCDGHRWFDQYYSNPDASECLETQKQLWQVVKALESPGQLPPNIVLAFTVLDPRFFLPEKRTKPNRDLSLPRAMPVPPTNANLSPIWEKDVRKKVTDSCISTSAINKLRSERLVPGAENDKYFSEKVIPKIPILLIQKPGRDGSGLGSSIDIVLPTGWAMPFWLAFILRCARPGALRESRSIAFETGNLRTPDVNDPDTVAYEKEALDTESELTEKYFRYPPNRRVNFAKLGITSPFFCNWKILMKEWRSTEKFFVLRDRDLLSLLERRISLTADGRKPGKINQFSDTELQSRFEHKNCLIRVRLSALRKGCPKRFAIICLPTSEDVEKFATGKNWMGPVEKLNSDPNETARKRLRKNHVVLLKRLRRQRVHRKKAFLNKMSTTLRENPQALYEFSKSEKLLAPNRTIVANHATKMSKLYLPECTKVRNSCDREVMGYLTVGDFSFREAKGMGIGYVTLDSLLQWMSVQNKFVLVRNPQTRQYRLAKLEVIF